MRALAEYIQVGDLEYVFWTWRESEDRRPQEKKVRHIISQALIEGNVSRETVEFSLDSESYAEPSIYT